MAPEIFKKCVFPSIYLYFKNKLTQIDSVAGHGKPVDVWAMGVITYFLLAGYTPFDRDSQQQEMEAIIAGDYSFTPEEYWCNVSEVAKDFVRKCLTVDPKKRPTAGEMLEHEWLASEEPCAVRDEKGEMKDLLPGVKKAFDAKGLWQKAAFSITALHRMATEASVDTGIIKMREDINKYKEESARVSAALDFRV